MDSTPFSRRLGRSVIAGGIGFGLLLLAGTILWFWLPRWAPLFVARHSPWVEPMVRARAAPAWRATEADWNIYEQRFAQWGPSAYPALSRLLQGDPALRASAQCSYPFIVPYSDSGATHDLKKDWGNVIVNATVIYENDQPWILARMNNRDHELRSDDPRQFILLEKAFARMRTRGTTYESPHMPGRLESKVMMELRFDTHVPYWIADRFIHLAMDGEAAMMTWLWITVRKEPTGPPPFQEYAVILATMPAPADAHVVTILLGTGSDPLAGVTLQVDAGAPVEIVAPFDHPLRFAGITRAINDALSGIVGATDDKSVIAIRGGPATPWSDVVTALGAAKRFNRKAGSSASEGDRVTLSPMVVPPTGARLQPGP